MFSLAVPTKKCYENSIFSESVDLKKKKQIKSTYNTCAKFQGKIVNPTLVGAPGSFRFLNKSHEFFVKNMSLKKFTHQFFQCRTSKINQ